jgi:hypothetical protein
MPYLAKRTSAEAFLDYQGGTDGFTGSSWEGGRRSETDKVKTKQRLK